MLFAGLTAVGGVEAKRRAKDVSSSLEQAKRFARGLELADENRAEGAPRGQYAVPFFYATNRCLVPAARDQVGIWFHDVRHAMHPSD